MSVMESRLRELQIESITGSRMAGMWGVSLSNQDATYIIHGHGATFEDAVADALATEARRQLYASASQR